MTEKEYAVEVWEGNHTDLRIGIEIADGPKTYRLMLTRPLDLEGHIEEISLDDIKTIREVEPGPRGAPPQIIEGDA